MENCKFAKEYTGMKRSMTIYLEAHDPLPGEIATIYSYIVSSYHTKNAQAVEISHQFANTAQK